MSAARSGWCASSATTYRAASSISAWILSGRVGSHRCGAPSPWRLASFHLGTTRQASRPRCNEASATEHEHHVWMAASAACYAAPMVIVFNRAGILVLAVSVAAWAGSQGVGFESWRLVAGFAVMAPLGIVLELQKRPSWRPRYFWLLPAWLTGLAGLGASLLDVGMTLAGGVVIGLGGAAVLAKLGWAILHKPGGSWLAGAAIAGTVVLGFQLLGYARPEWHHPVLYVVNAVALVAAIVCAYKMHLARRAKAPVARESQTELKGFTG